MSSEWVPLLQTGLWVGLIIGALWRYHKVLESLSEALRDRIKEGSGVDIGPIKVAERMAPLSTEKQKAKLEDELTQLQNTQQEKKEGPVLVTNVAGQTPPLSEKKARTRLLMAEDLAIRELQSEFGISMNRQVGFLDAMFVRDSAAIGIEVKYLRRAATEQKLKETAVSILAKTSSYGWKRFSLIIVVVYEGFRVPTETELVRLNVALSGFGSSVSVKVFFFEDLCEKYGLDPGAL
jgi:hypothetical protein